MLYVSIDTETGGLDPSYSLLEIGMVVDNLRAPKVQEGGGYFAARIVLIHEAMVLHPWAAAQHAKLLEEINTVIHSDWWRETLEGGHTFAAVSPDAEECLFDHGIRTWYTIGSAALPAFHDALDHLKVPWREGSIVPAGRGFAQFDIGFLAENGLLEPDNEGDSVGFKRRLLDPCTLYARPEDEVPPGLEEIMEREGMTPTGLHTACGDAIDVIRVLRRKLTPRG